MPDGNGNSPAPAGDREEEVMEIGRKTDMF